MHRSRIVFLLQLAALGGLTFAAVAAGDEQPKAVPTIEARLLDIAKTYADYGRVDEDLRWAPTLCRAPMPGRDFTPSVARFSASGDADTHGRKLYFLFAKDKIAYRELASKTPAVGQVIVKESWIPEAAKNEPKGPLPTDGNWFVPYARKDGTTYRAARKAALFIMMKTDPNAPDTDAGWVYGTVTADAKTVTAAGRLESCMACHQQAKYDRLFGLAKAEQAKNDEVGDKK